MGVAAALRSVGAVRSAFEDWDNFLARVASGRVRGKPAEVSVRTRRGTAITCQNTPMGRAPLWEVFASDDYPWKILRADLDPKDPFIIDVGAHIGAFTLAMVEKRSDLAASCYEPSPGTFALLSRNVKDNGLESTIEVHQEAVSAVAGEISFWEAEPGSCENSSVPIAGASCITVTAVTLAEAVERSARSVDLLKLDCEGAEHDMIPATPPDVWQRVRHIFLEYHPHAESSWDDLRAVLEANDFVIDWERHALHAVDGLGLVHASRRR